MHQFGPTASRALPVVFRIERGTMKNLRRLFGLGVLAALFISGGVRSGEASGEKHFVGAWKLAFLEQPGGDGKSHRRTECCGLLVYTADGHMSVQVMESEPQPKGSAGQEQYSQGGYEASYGTYRVDERTHTFSFHVEGALVRTLIGQDLPRKYEFSGNRLIVQSTRPEEKWKVVWERY